MSEASSVLNRIRQACSPPKKRNAFETLQSAPTSLVDLHNATPLVNVTSTTRSIARNGSNSANHSVTRPSNIKPTPIPTPKPADNPVPKPTETHPQTPPTTPPTKPSPTPSTTLAPNGSFELTPLSGLIKQSFADIALLRRLHEVQTPTYPSPAYTPPNNQSKPRFTGLSETRTTQTKTKTNGSPTNGNGNGNGTPKSSPKVKGNTSPQVQQAMVDFAKVEENLRRFEELYRQFLNYGGRFGEGAEEVHLVAVVCKRSDVVKGQIGPGDDTVPRVKRVWVDCGF